MPEPIEWLPRRGERPPAEMTRRRRLIISVLIIIVLLLFGGKSLLSYYVDALWFGSLGYGAVFQQSIVLQVAVFVFFAVVTFAILYGVFLAFRRAHAADMPARQQIVVGNQSLEIPLGTILKVVALVASAIIALMTGGVLRANWTDLALYWYAPPGGGGLADPVLGHSLNFYLFTLPAWQMISGWLLVMTVLICLIALIFMLLTSGSQAVAGGRGVRLDLPWRGLSIACGALLLAIALRVYLARFELLFTDHTVLGGVTYTDAHIMLSGLLVVVAALVVGAAMAFTNACGRARLRRLALAVVPAVACYIVLQAVSWYVSGFIVKPNEMLREKPFITHNIEFTRRAFGLDRMQTHEFPAESTVDAADIANNQATLENIRLWDWHALQDTLRQIQEIRTYYDFPDIDIDRYEIDGQLRQVMLATRELSEEKLPVSSRNWINEKLIYTHGYGITMNPVNGFTHEGLPTLVLSNMPVESTARNLQVKRPEVYFGELTDTDVYVKTRQKEFNYPLGQTNSVTSYEGTGGIVLGGFFRRLLIALDRGDLTKLPFSDDITPQSRLLMRRSVLARVTTLAPFLTFEHDPYIVLGDDGRLVWMLDGFTTSDSYPYATHYTMNGAAINYLRNSVKVTVDAYDGATTFYVYDPSDPIISAYRRIFPTLFKDASAMPAALRKHVRYPELLLQLQARVYGLYHVTEPEVFYNREDLWTVASEVGTNQQGQQATLAMPPNFVLMKLPGEKEVEFVEILPFTPSNRNNLIGWIAGRCDGEHYGTAVVYNFPKTKLVDGPLQIEARIDQNAQLSSQMTLWNQQGSHVRRGALLVIPFGKALLYAEPIYLQAERSPMPELRLVVLALQDRLGYGPTFEAALSSLFGAAASNLSISPAETKPNAPAGTNAAATPADDTRTLISEAARNFNEYQRLTAEGKLAEAGQKLEALKRTLEKLNARQK
jgi:hypothetical protein